MASGRFDLSFLDRRPGEVDPRPTRDPSTFGLVHDPTAHLDPPERPERPERPAGQWWAADDRNPLSSLTAWMGFGVVTLQFIGLAGQYVDPALTWAGSIALGIGIVSERWRKPDMNMRRLVPKLRTPPATTPPAGTS